MKLVVDLHILMKTRTDLEALGVDHAFMRRVVMLEHVINKFAPMNMM